MGLYLHQDETDQCVTFSEIGTGIKIKAIMNSQYSGKTGDIWLTRILAPPHPTLPVGVVFGTPYQILGSSMQEWESFLDRTYSKTKQKTQQESHEYLMKFGLSWNYWLEYVFEAYVNYAPNLIYMKGFPDIDESRPHSKANY